MNPRQQNCPGCDATVFFGQELCQECDWPLDDLQWPDHPGGESPTLVEFPAVSPPSENVSATSDNPAAAPPPERESREFAARMIVEEREKTVGTPQKMGSRPKSPPKRRTAVATPSGLPVVEASLGQKLTVGSKQVMQCRVTNASAESISYFLTVEAPELGLHCRFRQDLRPQESTIHHEPYEVQHHGTFYVSFVVETDVRGVQQGTSTVYVAGNDSKAVINVEQSSDAKMNAGSMTSNIHVNLAESESADFQPVDLSWRPSLKFTRAQLPDEPTESLSIRVFKDDGIDNVCLFAKDKVTFGKSRSCDVTLRLIPESQENEKVWGRISRKHAVCQHTTTGVEWLNLQCTNGTMIDGIYRGADHSQTLRNGMKITLAEAIPLTCSVLDIPRQFERLHYAGFQEDSQMHADSQQGAATVRFSRGGVVASRESYILCQQACLIGSAPDCAIVLNVPDVAAYHAMILFLRGSFWLEALEPLYVRGARVQPHELVLLTPDSGKIQVGRADLMVSPLKQLSLDIPI